MTKLYHVTHFGDVQKSGDDHLGHYRSKGQKGEGTSLLLAVVPNYTSSCTGSGFATRTSEADPGPDLWAAVWKLSGAAENMNVIGQETASSNPLDLRGVLFDSSTLLCLVCLSKFVIPKIHEFGARI